MIDRTALLKDLRPIVVELVDDLRTRLEEHQPSANLVRRDYDEAVANKRTAQTYQTFADEHLTQVAVAWVLATVFVRFLEDNQLCDEPWISGPGKRLAQARDRYTHWLKQNTHLSDRDYLLFVFSTLGKLPGMGALLGEKNTLLHRIGPTADGASKLRQFWQQLQGEGLAHDFGDAELDTRFLGDLYQDLSEAAQKKFALVQTPVFVEEFILDKTLEPALAEFGLAETKLIDPACGSGHFLLGAFSRLFGRWQVAEPGTKPQVLAQRALDAVAGVDLNPFAVAIARFRLLVEALKVCGVTRLRDAYDFAIQVAAGDSLLHGRHQGARQRMLGMDLGDEFDFEHFFGSEDKELLHAIFGRSYQAVVGNPPYIVARDKALNDLYRKRWPEVCHGKYSLGAPFTQLFFELARPKLEGARSPGYVGMITANSFMKREFGKRLIEEYLGGRVELNGVLDLSGAYIPGHGTPTVILFGRTRTAIGSKIRAVLGIKGEPSTPADPAKGLVWTAIVTQFEQPGSESEFVSCGDVGRDRFAKHPWSIGGGGAAELKEQIEERAHGTLGDLSHSIGFASFTGTDEAFVVDRATLVRQGFPSECIRRFVYGEVVRDWAIGEAHAFAPYDSHFEPIPLDADAPWARRMWHYRTTIGGVVSFGRETRLASGDAWWTWYRWIPEKYRTPLSIAFAFVATHNHFVLERGGKVFNRSAPVIKLPEGATEDDHLGLLGLLNSSVACFWCQQVMHNKGGPGGGSSKDEKWHDFYEFAGTALGPFPVPEGRPLAIARRLDASATKLRLFKPRSVLDGGERSRSGLDKAKAKALAIRAEMVFLQEEIDWSSYRLYGLIEDDLTYNGVDVDGLQVGERAFEMVMAKQVADGMLQTKWFEWLHATPITEVPRTWPKAYRDLVQRRINLIQSNRDLALVEQVQSKRRWDSEPWEKIEKAACGSWLLDRMEDKQFWPEPRLTSVARFAERLRKDPDFVQVAKLYRGRDDFDFDALVLELVDSESVPFLPVLRYKDSGLRKRADWEATWELQRKEDSGEKVGAIPVPPRYASADFLKSSYWSLRGKLDVPKERFVSYPGTERSDDPTLVFTWAGFDHAQQAQAIATYYLERKDGDGAEPESLVPLLAGLRELLPWLHQWHAAASADAQGGVAAEYQDFFSNELQGMGITEFVLKGWAPKRRKAR